MKKIKSEELLSKFRCRLLDDEDLERVTGGNNGQYLSCLDECYKKARQDNDGAALQSCLMGCTTT